VALGSQRIRETGYSAICSAAAELNQAEEFWREGARLWKSGQHGEAEREFKLCADMLTGIAGILVEATGQTMHVERSDKC
jgi:hypothetical protein